MTPPPPARTRCCAWRHLATLVLIAAVAAIAHTPASARYIDDLEPTIEQRAPHLTDQHANSVLLSADTTGGGGGGGGDDDDDDDGSRRPTTMQPHIVADDARAAVTHLDDDSRSPIDCSFDEKIGSGGMCSWRADEDGRALWRTGNAALVDSANSIVKPGAGGKSSRSIAHS